MAACRCSWITLTIGGEIDSSSGGLRIDRLSDREQRRFEAALGISATTEEDDRRNRVRALEELAADEWRAWLSGASRPETLATLERQRLLQVFRHVRGDAPTIRVLVEDFGISEGRAAAIISRLRFGEAAWVREQQLRELVSMLRSRVTHAASQAEDDESDLQIDLAMEADRELIAAIRLVAAPPQARPSANPCPSCARCACLATTPSAGR